MRQHALIVGALLCISCAPSQKPSATFDTEAVAAEPRLAFVWHDQLTSWKYLGADPKEFASPTHVGATDELVVATSEGEVIKYQAANGKALWRRRLEGEFHAGPVVGSGLVFLADLEGRVSAIDVSSGEAKWKAQVDNSVESRGAYADGRLFISDSADKLHAFDAQTGESLWSYARDVPEYFTVKGSCTPVVDRDAVYCGFSDGFLVAVQIDTGERIWEVDLSNSESDFADVDGEVIVAGERIYAASYAGGIYALERESGAPIWRRDIDSAADFSLADGRLFVASAVGRVVALDADNGEPIWGFKFKDSIPGSIATFGPYVLAFTTDGPMHVLDAESGYPHVKWLGTSGFGAAVETGSSRVYALTNHGQLIGMKLGY